MKHFLRRGYLPLFLVACGQIWGDAPAPALDFGPLTHDPSTLACCGDTYWLFATGRGVKSFSSTNLIEWKPGPPVFTQFPAWVREVVTNHTGFFWAPDVVRVKNRYLVYYSVSSWGKNNSAIGLASNTTLDPNHTQFQWKDEGLVVRSHAKDHFNAIDPAVLLDHDGTLWLAFGSFWSGIKLVQLDPATGKRLTPDSPLFSLAYHESIEAPFIYHRRGDYYLFVNWGKCCQGVDSTYEIRVGRSSRITGPYLDREGKDLLQKGGTLLLETEGPSIGPGHAGILSLDDQDWLSFHFYDGRNRGKATLGLRKLDWTPDGWPVIPELEKAN